MTIDRSEISYRIPMHSNDIRHGYYMYHLYTRIFTGIPDDRAIATLWDSMNHDQHIQWAYAAHEFMQLVRMK